MGANSKIEWTDHTFNPWRGCSKVSPGCQHCYAETLSKRNPVLLGEWGAGKPRVLASEDMWRQPLKWNRQAELAWENWKTAVEARAGDSGPMPQRPRVFCASLADWLDEEVPIEWLARLMELIMRTPSLDWLLLTKRPQNWHQRILAALAEVEGIKGDWPSRDPETQTGGMLNDWLGGSPPSNVWIGTTVEDQQRADERIPELLKIPARVRFLSCEPMLAHVDLESVPLGETCDCCHTPVHVHALTGFTGCHGDCDGPTMGKIHWVICGGESGPKARPMHPAWARSLRDQCAYARVPFLFKQWGEWGPLFDDNAAFGEFHDGRWIPDCLCEDGEASMFLVGKAKAGRVLDAVEHNGIPQVERRVA